MSQCGNVGTHKRLSHPQPRTVVPPDCWQQPNAAAHGQRGPHHCLACTTTHGTMPKRARMGCSRDLAYTAGETPRWYRDAHCTATEAIGRMRQRSWVAALGGDCNPIARRLEPQSQCCGSRRIFSHQVASHPNWPCACWRSFQHPIELREHQLREADARNSMTAQSFGA